jgi:hypothetical protein
MVVVKRARGAENERTNLVSPSKIGPLSKRFLWQISNAGFFEREKCRDRARESADYRDRGRTNAVIVSNGSERRRSLRRDWGTGGKNIL